MFHKQLHSQQWIYHPVVAFPINNHQKWEVDCSYSKSPSHLGHSTSRVNRLYNEDKYSANLLQVKESQIFNFSIFDGHGGDQCSTYLVENLSLALEDLDQLVENDNDRQELFKNTPRMLVDIGNGGINTVITLLQIGRRNE